MKVTPNPSRFVDHRQVYGEDFEGMYPSVGACDEFIRLFLFRRRMRQEEILSLEGRLGEFANFWHGSLNVPFWEYKGHHLIVAIIYHIPFMVG